MSNGQGGGGRTLAPSTIAMIGCEYGSLTVIDIGRGEKGRTLFTCRCRCGKRCQASPWELRSGRRRDCGCGWR